MNKELKKINRKSYVTAKLTFFDWGWADNIIYKLKAKSTEKNKGLEMIERIKNLFGISNDNVKDHEDETIKEEVKRIQWTRDERGNIVSPFKSKKIM